MDKCKKNEKLNIAYRYRVYPTEEQKVFFTKSFGCCRFIWNKMLSDRVNYYQANKQTLKNAPAMYKKDFPFLKEVDSLALADVYLNLNKAYDSFFKRVSGFPKFKSKHKSKKSYTTYNQNGTVAIKDGCIRLPKVGLIKAKLHRLPSPDYKLKSATVTEERDNKYYISLCFEYEKEAIKQPLTLNSNVIGLDYKSDGLYADSKGNIPAMPHFYRKSQRRLAHLQRLQKNKKGQSKNESKSKNWLKSQKKINKLYRHVANQRKDFLHKLSTEIANQYDAVCVEDLNMRAMSSSGFHNGKATLDNGYGLFLNMLEYKLTGRGKYFVKVDKWYPSSQLCSNCGSRQKLKLSERVYICPHCGAKIDRDFNAAINIKNEGLRILLNPSS